MGIMCHAFHEIAEKSSKIVPLGAPLLLMYSPETSFTDRSEDILYTLGPNGLFRGCKVLSSRSM
jgi:hypothetical protein